MLNPTQAQYARYIGRARYGGFGHRDASELDYANANNFQDVWRNATETADVEVTRVDYNNRIRLGNAWYQAARTPIRMNVPLNAMLSNNLAQTIYIANDDLSITSIYEIHATAGADAGAVTLKITKETGTQAAGTGATIMTGTLDLKGTANTFQIGTLAYGYGRRAVGGEGNGIGLKAGDRLSIVITGVVTSLAGLQLTMYAQPGMLIPHKTYSFHRNADVITQGLYLSNEPRTLSAVRVFFGTKGSDAGAVTLDITKETGTTAQGSGTTMLAATVDLKGAANTVFTPALSATATVLAVAPGNRISMKITGTATAVADLTIGLFFAPNSSSTVEIMLQVGLNANQGTDQTFFIADRLFEIVDISEVHGTAAGGALKGLVTQDITTGAPGSGLAMHTDNTSAGFDLNATANTVQVGTLGNRRNRLLQRGERLGFKHSAGGQSTAGLIVAATLRPM